MKKVGSTLGRKVLAKAKTPLARAKADLELTKQH